MLGDPAQLRLDAFGEQRQHLRVDGIGLGEAAERAGEVADLAWIDDDDGHVGGNEAGGDDAFEAAGGLEDDALEVEMAQALDESVDAGLIVCDGESLVGRTQVDIEAVFRDIDTDGDGVTGRLIHDPTLRIRALRPKRLFGILDGRDASCPSSSTGSVALGANGLTCAMTLSAFDAEGDRSDTNTRATYKG